MKILITGGTGLVGSALSQHLIEKGHTIIHLSRRAGFSATGVRAYAWDLDKNEMDATALRGLDAIVNLAGAPIAQRWTPAHKSAILRSRVDGTRLLYQTLLREQAPLPLLISASAVGYYPNDFEKTFSEEAPPGDDFLSLVCQKWEQEAMQFENLSTRTLRLRIGIVLARDGGALPQMARPIRYGLGAALGSGRQWMPWVHLHDLVRIFAHSLENPAMHGVYNAAGPNNATNAQLTKALARALGKPLFLPAVPAFALKLALGEMAQTVLASNRVSTAKLQATGFRYLYSDLPSALRQIYA